MSGVDRAVRDQRVIVSQVVSGGNVIAGFIPEEGQAQQGQMKNENGNKDEGKNLQRGDESRAIGGCCHLSVSFSFELPYAAAQELPWSEVSGSVLEPGTCWDRS